MKKNLLYLLIISVFFVYCTNKSNEEQKVDNSIIISDVNSILDSWHKAASTANFDDYFSKMDSISVFIGTDASENWTRNEFQEFSKPYFDDGNAWSFTPLERNVYVSEDQNIVWFDELLKTWMGTCRGSGVLEKGKNNWKIKHYVLSVAIPNEDIKQVIVAKRENDSIFQLSKIKND